MKTLRGFRGNETTYYYCSHYQAGEVRPGSAVAKREGNKPGWQLELCRVTSTMREVDGPEGRFVDSQTLSPSTMFVHVPTDYDLVEEVVPKGNGPGWRLVKTYSIGDPEAEAATSEGVA